MRVVAGSAGGIPLQVPRTDIRPTMDRVKAAIFSSLGEKIVNARVLDLFAGCGALGIEALSRGCESATFIESNPQAVKSIEHNLAKTRLKGTILEMDVFRFLDRSAAPHTYNVIFADPPYARLKGGRDFTSELLHSTHLRDALAEDGVFVLEKMPGSRMDTNPCWECIRSKKYGSTEVVFLRSNAVS